MGIQIISMNAKMNVHLGRFNIELESNTSLSHDSDLLNEKVRNLTK